MARQNARMDRIRKELSTLHFNSKVEAETPQPSSRQEQPAPLFEHVFDAEPSLSLFYLEE